MVPLIQERKMLVSYYTGRAWRISKSRLIGKDPDVGRDWGQEEKGTTE